jgi:hypothetical protein
VGRRDFIFFRFPLFYPDYWPRDENKQLCRIYESQTTHCFAIEKNYKTLTVFGDSMNVIKWIKGTQRCTNIRHANLVEDINFLQTSFDSLTCRHVYRERNKEATGDRKKGQTWHWASGK